MTAGTRWKVMHVEAAQYGRLGGGIFVWFLLIFSDITFVWRFRWIRFQRNFGNDLCTECSWARLNWQSNARGVRAHFLVDTAVKTLIVSKALKVPSPGLQDKSDHPLKMNHSTMKLTFHQMHDLLRMVDKLVIFKKQVPFLTNWWTNENQSRTSVQQNKRPFSWAGRPHEGHPHCFTVAAIEQVLMRSLKTSGSLTRGRGMTESTTSDLAALYSSVCRDESWQAVSKPRIWRSPDKPGTWRTLGRCFVL